MSSLENIAFFDAMCDKTHMNGEVKNSALYEKLMQLMPQGLNENAWANLAQVNRSFFQGLKGGKTPRTDTLERVVGAIGLTLAEFYAGQTPNRANVRHRLETPSNDYRPAPADLLSNGNFPHGLTRDIPVLGTAEGAAESVGENGDPMLIESICLSLSEVIEYKVRPSSLVQRKDIYALYISGESMVPRFEQGELVYVDPQRPPSIGDDVIVQLRAERADGDEQVIRALVKRLRRRSTDYAEFEQYNPPMTFRLPTNSIARMHRIMRLDELV